MQLGYLSGVITVALCALLGNRNAWKFNNANLVMLTMDDEVERYPKL